MRKPAEPSTASDDASSAIELVGGHLGRYEVLLELESGAGTHRYVARDVESDADAKLLTIERLTPAAARQPEIVARFVDASRLAARVTHPYVMSTIDTEGLVARPPFVVTDHVEGAHLGRVLHAIARKAKQIPERLVARILLDALSGLSAIHAAHDENGDRLGLVHRAIAPHELLLGIDGNVHVAGLFALASSADEIAQRAAAPEGRLAYLAPEQLEGSALDARADVFAMGVVLWESLTARRLFRCPTDEETRARILSAVVPRPGDVEPCLAHWNAVLERALAREPSRRFRSADDLGAAIDSVARANDGIASPRSLGLYVRELLYDTIEAEHRRIVDALAHRAHARSGTHPRASLSDAPTPVVPTLARGDSRPSIPPAATRRDVAVEAVTRVVDVLPWTPTDPGVAATLASSETGLREVDPEVPRGRRRVIVVRRLAMRTRILVAVAFLLVVAFSGLAGYFANAGG